MLISIKRTFSFIENRMLLDFPEKQLFFELVAFEGLRLGLITWNSRHSCGGNVIFFKSLKRYIPKDGTLPPKFSTEWIPSKWQKRVKNWHFLCLFQPKIVTILLSGYNAKENTNSSHPKNAKKHNFGAFLDHFLPFWWTPSHEEFRGYRTVYWYISPKNLEKNHIASTWMPGTPCNQT